MRLSAAPLILLLAASACAPSADLRIDTPAGPLTPGRLVVVPMEAQGRGVGAEGDVLDKTEFESADAHAAAFWSTFVSALGSALPAMDVRLGVPTGGSVFSARRALVRGAKQGYGAQRWTVETLSLPDTVAYGALGADYVLFVEDAMVTTDQPQMIDFATGAADVPGMAVRGRAISAAGRMVLYRAGQDAPALSYTVAGS